jgi:predicted Zn-dependent protease
MKLVWTCALALSSLGLGLIGSSAMAAVEQAPASNLKPQPIEASLGDRLKSSTSNDAFFNRASQELPEDLYVLYRIVERVARSNGLDERPWRIRLSGQYDVNAFASELNTLTFLAGIMDQLHGDNAALACVVGHEIAHHTQNHIPIMAQVQGRMAQLMAEAEAEAVAEIQAARQQQQTNNTIGGLLGSVLGRVGGSTGRVLGSTTRDVLNTASAAQRQEAEARALQLYEEKVAGLAQEFSAVLQRHEFEADEFGFKFMVRAGFDPNGCARVMSLLDRMEGSRLPSFSHPNPADRIRALSALNTPANVNDLVAEGRRFLAGSSQPLRYGVSRDGVSLRVESRFGSGGGSGFPE